MDALAEIEHAASIATEMSVGFSKLAGTSAPTENKRYVAGPESSGMSTEEFLRSLAARNAAEEGFDDAEFQATLVQHKVDTRETKAPTATTATVVKKKASGEKLQINVDVAPKAPVKVVDTSDTWIAPAQPKREVKTVQKSADEEDEEERRRVEQEKKRLQEERAKMEESEQKQRADEESKKKQAEDERKKQSKEEKRRKKKEEEARKAAAEDEAKKKAEADAKKKAEEEAKKKTETAKTVPAPAPVEVSPRDAAGASPRGAGDETFDKKAYNAHVRKAKQFATENNHQKALEEYLAAAAVRPGHEGLEKKIKSLRKKVGGK